MVEIERIIVTPQGWKWYDEKTDQKMVMRMRAPPEWKELEAWAPPE
jgi:hypothetical protein